MSAPPAAAVRRKPPRLGMVALFLVLAVVAGKLHLASRSPRSELGSHPDEAAHFVTGLMVRDYVASGMHEWPMRYASEYYRHYPKIGLGVWPPFFYLVQAGWTLLYHADAGAVLRLMYVLGLGLAVLTGWWLWREFGWVEAVLGSVLLTALPLVQQYSNMVMAEALSALLMFAAAGYFARYLEGEEWRGGIGFGVCAGLAIMTKGTGLALVFVPVLGIIFTGRYELLGRKSLWVAAGLVAGIAGPWTWIFRNAGRGGWEEANPSMRFTEAALRFYGQEICVALGWMLAALALVGAVSIFMPKRKQPAMAQCSLALVLGVWIFQSLTPVGLEARHLMPAMPALMVLAMAGLRMIGQQVRWRAALAAGVAVVFFGWPRVFPPAMPGPGYGSIGSSAAVSPFRIPRKRWGGYERAAEVAMALAGSGNAPGILIASDARGEGMLIADVAARDPHRPSFTVERASKILASSTWSGSGYQSLYQTPEEVREALVKAGVGVVVTDESAPMPLAHEKLLLELMKSEAAPLAGMAMRDGRQWGLIKLNRLPAAAK